MCAVSVRVMYSWASLCRDIIVDSMLPLFYFVRGVPFHGSQIVKRVMCYVSGIGVIINWISFYR